MENKNNNAVTENARRGGKFLSFYANLKSAKLISNLTKRDDFVDSFFTSERNGCIKAEKVVKVYGKVIKPTDEDAKNTIVRQVSKVIKIK
jgi:hypothetical protein